MDIDTEQKIALVADIIGVICVIGFVYSGYVMFTGKDFNAFWGVVACMVGMTICSIVSQIYR